jgi:hypothetical protein
LKEEEPTYYGIKNKFHLDRGAGEEIPPMEEII